MANKKRLVSIVVAGGAIFAFGIAGIAAKSALSGNAQSGTQEEAFMPAMETPACDFSQWVGLNRSDVEARLAETGRPNRVLRPGQPMTMDYRPDRINVELDDSDRVVRVFCG